MLSAPSNRERQLSQTRPVKFAQAHNVEIAAIVRRLYTKPFIRIEAGAFIGYLEASNIGWDRLKGELSRLSEKW